MFNESIFDTFPLLETSRLRLVRHHLDHATDMYQLRTDKAVMEYLDTHQPKSIEDIKRKIKENIINFDNNIGINWVLQLKESEEIIGYMGIWRVDKKNNRGELGYAIKQAHWNKGLATEASIKIINWAFESMNLNTIMANTNPKNEASQALLSKLGFMQEAHFRQDYYFDGQYLDSAIYGLIKEDWKF